MKPFTSVTRAIEKIDAYMQSQAAREVAILGSGTRLTRSGRIDNIRGNRSAITIGQNSIIAGHLQVFAHDGGIRIGDWFYLGRGSSIWSAAEVIIGDRVLVSHNVNIHDTNSHPFDAEARFQQTKSIVTKGHPRTNPGIVSTPVRIGNDVWIGYSASVLRGVTIGEGAVIGAASVVTRDVEPWTVVAGNPARVIKRLVASP